MKARIMYISGFVFCILGLLFGSGEYEKLHTVLAIVFFMRANEE